MKVRIAFVSFLVLFQVSSAAAQETVIRLESDRERSFVGQNASFFEDTSEALTFDSVLTAEIQSRFEPLGRDVLAAGITTSAFWLKLSVQNQSLPSTSKWILSLDYPPLDSVTLFQQDDPGNWNRIDSGDRIPFSTREIAHHNAAFELSLPDTLVRTLYLKVKTGGSVLIGAEIQSEDAFLESNLVASIGYGIFVGALVIMLFYNLFLFISLKDLSYLAYVLFIINNLVLQLCYSGHVSQFLFPNDPDWANRLLPISVALQPLVASFFTVTFLRTKEFTPIIHKILLFVASFAVVNFFIALFFSAHTAGFPNSINMSAALVVVIVAGVVSLRRGNKSARYFLIAWSFLVVGGAIVTLKSFGFVFPSFIARNGSMISSLIEIALLSVALADKYNLFKKEKEEAVEEILNLKENANRELEKKVIERTAELNQSLATLKTTQNQLIQKEKLASLGEITAGVAHEIQNPLNFANGFSEVSEELVLELKEELEKGDVEEAMLLSDDLIQNLKMINHHAKRASGIVKGMLEHSKSSSGEPELVDLNELADEFVQLSYHGMKSKNPNFNVKVAKEYQNDLPKIMATPQDLGRVILNLLNNAYYAVSEKQAKEPEYSPSVSLQTRQTETEVVLAVADNGVGMEESVRNKVFEPFFTTKPTGEGTGLGLSLSYDIVTKGHNGHLQVESVEGEGTTFEMRLPLVVVSV